MRVQIQCVAEALNEGDGAASGPAVRGGNARPPADRGKHGAHPDLQYVPDQGGIVSEPIAHGKGNRQHPLTDRHLGKNTIHQMRRRVGHPPPAARRTEPTTFAGIRHEPVQAAGIAVHPQKSPRQDAAIEEGAEFPFDEPGDQTVALTLPGQKGFDMAGHHAIEYALFRPALAVLAGAFAHGRIPAAEHKIGPLRFYIHFVYSCRV